MNKAFFLTLTLIFSLSVTAWSREDDDDMPCEGDDLQVEKCEGQREREREYNKAQQEGRKKYQEKCEDYMNEVEAKYTPILEAAAKTCCDRVKPKGFSGMFSKDICVGISREHFLMHECQEMQKPLWGDLKYSLGRGGSTSAPKECASYFSYDMENKFSAIIDKVIKVHY